MIDMYYETSSEEEYAFDVVISKKGLPEGNLIIVDDFSCLYNTVGTLDTKSKKMSTISQIDD